MAMKLNVSPRSPTAAVVSIGSMTQKNVINSQTEPANIPIRSYFASFSS